VKGIFLHVRQGFEDDAQQELADQLGTFVKTTGQPQFKPLSAYVLFPQDRFPDLSSRKKINFDSLVFARQLIWIADQVDLPETGDRITPIMAAISEKLLPGAESNAFSTLSIETPDTDSAKELNQFCKALTRPLENALNKARLLPKGKGAAHLPRIHVILLSNVRVLVGLSDIENSSPWITGIPRLKFPSDAPSRSTLKLEEAFLLFLGREQSTRLLQPGMVAVDLGACPGGWTYQFVKRKIKTIAVDNGLIAPSLMQTGLVTHLAEDAFKFRPQASVDWLVCDVVEQPSKITELVLHWFTRRYCKFAIFNLKLPMKRRYLEVKACLEHLQSTCAQEGLMIKLQAKQLYHDRKEVTVFAAVSLKS